MNDTEAAPTLHGRHFQGRMDTACMHRGFWHWPVEKDPASSWKHPKPSWCRCKGTTNCPAQREPMPVESAEPLFSSLPPAEHFWKHAGSYNSNLQLPSSRPGFKDDRNLSGIQTFAFCGQFHHRIGRMLPVGVEKGDWQQ